MGSRSFLSQNNVVTSIGGGFDGFRYSVVFVTWNPVKCLGQLIHNGCTRLHHLVVGVMGGF